MKVKELREMLDEMESRYDKNPERFIDVEFEDVEVDIEFTHKPQPEWYSGYYEEQRFLGYPVAMFIREGALTLDCYD